MSGSFLVVAADGGRQPQRYSGAAGEFYRVDSARRGKGGGEIPGGLLDWEREGGNDFEGGGMAEEEDSET